MADSAIFDDLLSTIGFGKWQIIIFILPVLANSLVPVHLLGASFFNAPVSFRCFTGQELNYGSDEADFLNNNPSPNMTNDTYFNSLCQSHENNNINYYDTILVSGPRKQTFLSSCPIVEYDTSVFTSTVVSKFDLICERANLRPLFVTCHAIGNMVGSLVGGYSADRWGRRRAVQIGSVINIFVVVAMIFVPYYSLMLLVRFIAGCAVTSTLVAAWSLALEITPCRYRHIAGMLLGSPFSVSTAILAGMAYYIRSWNYLMLIGTSYALLLLPCSFIAWESPRWLLQKGELDEAIRTLQRAIALNKANLPRPLKTILTELQEQRVSEAKTASEQDTVGACVLMVSQNVMQYFRSSEMCTIIICMAVVWLIHFFVYIGVALNANNFTANNPFLYVCMTGVLDIAAVILTTPVTYMCGRKTILFVGFMGSGTLLLLNLAIPLSYYWLKCIIVMTAFFLLAGSIQVNFLYATEVFPTEIRARGFAFVNVMGNIGGSLSPFVTDILPQYNWWSTGVTFGCSGIAASFFVPFLPETKGTSLPETLSDVEERSKKNKSTKEKEGMENTSYVTESCHL